MCFNVVSISLISKLLAHPKIESSCNEDHVSSMYPMWAQMGESVSAKSEKVAPSQLEYVGIFPSGSSGPLYQIATRLVAHGRLGSACGSVAFWCVGRHNCTGVARKHFPTSQAVEIRWDCFGYQNYNKQKYMYL